MAGPIAFNVGLATWGYYAGLPGASDSWIAVPIETTGLEADGTLVDYDTLAAVLGASNNEQTTMGRVTLTGVGVVTDDTSNSQVLDFDPVEWAGASGNGTSRVLFCYKPDSGSADSAILPMFADDLVVAAPSGTVTYTPHADGLAESAVA